MNKLRIAIIIEILGRPPEHITLALNDLLAKLGAENGVKIINKNVREPQPVKDAQNLFTTFAEVELELESLINLFGIIFAYMPAHVEVISPEKITIQNTELSELGTRLTERLHEYDAVAKRLVVEREELAKKLYQFAPHLFAQPASQSIQQALQQNISPKKKNKKAANKKLKAKSS